MQGISTDQPHLDFMQPQHQALNVCLRHAAGLQQAAWLRPATFQKWKECLSASELTDDLLVPFVVKLSTTDCRVCISRFLTENDSFGTAGLGPPNDTLLVDAADG